MTAEYLTADALLLPGLRHGFFTRRGGVSTGPFGALNCSLNGRDEDAAVRENRRRAAAALGVPAGALHGLHQVHGTAVAVLEEPWPEAARPRADAVVTRRRGLAIGVVTADCGPVLFADAAAGVAGAAHAGWRGALAGVLEETVAAMERLGARRDRIAAVLGPCIRQPSYEVGPDLRDAVLARAAADARHFAPGRREDRWQFDLAGYCAARLAALGLGTVAVLPHDTLAEPDRFFSYRAATLAGGGPVGHQLSAIALAT
ncbi:peptidoglycan editing factor PgeF [Roseomonas sp. NAR14]|uniref:Purine nucleoside phosphorylase n=1 Tax=Roseomonas acroporae TaxID=2937791 RepID=A0A9X2BZF5_9PROT|nr:peptidoglycan editing factor PgeF [Roseomonas acroporae]MCK8786975.1 peptidoglycan editing factor PgeF [Roseomonas acroporae]